jgi:hypothetical protein
VDGSLIEIGKLAEPATRLVERISDAVGWVMEPTRIRRIARGGGSVVSISLFHSLSCAPHGPKQSTEILARGRCDVLLDALMDSR